MFRVGLLLLVFLVTSCNHPEKNAILLKYVSLDKVEQLSGSTSSGKIFAYRLMFYSNKKIIDTYEHIISTEMRCLLFNGKKDRNNNNDNWRKIKKSDIFGTGDITFIKQDSDMYLYSSELYFVDDGFSPVTDHNQYLSVLKDIEKTNGEIICKINVSGNSISGSRDKESPSYSDGINLPANLFIDKLKQ